MREEAEEGLRQGLLGPARGDCDHRAFLAAADPAEALGLWFGRAELARLARRPGRLRGLLGRDVAALDVRLGAGIDAVLHHPRVRRLEASWRGLRHLVEAAGGAETAAVKLFDAGWSELCNDFARALDFDQSRLFQAVYSEEFGMPGGTPYGLIVADYAVTVRRSPEWPRDDVGALGSLAAVAAAAFAPVVIGVEPELFGLDAFAGLAPPVDLAATFAGPDYRRWQGLRQSEDARFLGVVAPRILLRLPYGTGAGSAFAGFVYREGCNERDGGHLWGSGAYAYGAAAIRAFLRHGWFADLGGPGDDDAAGLPDASFGTDRPGIALRHPVEVSISERLEQILNDLGFIVLAPRRLAAGLCVANSPSLQAAAPATTPSPANGNARLGAMLNHMLSVSRFAHAIKVMARDRVGGFVDIEAFERHLARWLASYAIGNDDASPEQKARHPLRAARVRIAAVPGKPGALACIVHLEPHADIDRVVSDFELRTELAVAVSA